MSEQEGLKGRVHSFQSLGTLDGPGVRFVVFLQGCHLRCACCHNPDTWDRTGGECYTPAEVLQRTVRYRSYFGSRGGITLSGGEPLLQARFATEVFGLCREAGIHTCLDTSGSLWSRDVEALLEVTDHVLLDVKYTADDKYRAYVGCSLRAPLRFLEELEQRKIPTTLRQVIIPTLSDGEENPRTLRALASRYTCVQGIELLPFRKVCQVKYDKMGVEFPLAHLPEPTRETMERLERMLSNEK